MEPIRGKQEIFDPSYRYKMHKVVFQKEKTKTCITNLDKIADDIKIPDRELIVSYLKKRLSIAIAEKNDRHIITSAVDTKAIQGAIYEFIEYFVLCKQCRLPELTYGLEKKHLSVYCRSCGKVDAIDSNEHTEKIIMVMEAKLSNESKKKKVKKSKELDHEVECKE
jgi:translation initiation factor 5